MSTPPERPGMTSGDPLAPGTEAPRHESGLPGTSPGYTSPPPPGAVDTASWASAPAAPAAGRYTLASWWSRVGALVIDSLVLFAGWIALMALFGSIFSVGFLASEEAGITGVAVALALSVLAIAIVSLLYAPLMMARTNGKTLGRMATGIRVVRADGQPITFGFAMLREVAVKALLFGIAGSITAGLANLADWLWPLWDDENRALHDFVVNTRVVRD